MTARQHHYLSQCYLKGFTKGQSKKSKLSVIDFKEKKSFESIPRNVGGVRDFNRIDLDGFDQNQLELELSKFESDAATALKQLKDSLVFSGQGKEVILNLIAFIAVRSPERREHMRQTQAQIAECVMGMLHNSEQLWEDQVARMRDDNPDFSSRVTYQESKEFFERKQYSIEVKREFHIAMEMAQVEAIIPCLINRKWLLLVSDDDTGPFITTDWPVNLSWKELDQIPEFYRKSPGFGLMGTEVYFPVSQHLALIGDFEGRDAVVDVSREMVALLNTKMLYNYYKQVYSPGLGFRFVGKNNDLLSGKKLLDGF